jgi:hypothetical protein
VAEKPEREAVLGYAEKMAGELHEVADHLQRAVAAFQATVRDFQQWVEEARSPGGGSLLTRPTSSLAAGAVALAPQPAQDAPPAPELPGERDRRAGTDRRSGEDRRIFVAEGLAGRIIRSLERREAPERRSGLERRAAKPAEASFIRGLPAGKW